MLAAMAFANWLTLANYMLLTINTTYEGHSTQGPYSGPESKARFCLLQNMIAYTLHFIALWLNLAVAIWRYKIVRLAAVLLVLVARFSI